MQWFLKYRKALRTVGLGFVTVLVPSFAYLGWNWVSHNHEALRDVALIVVATIGIGFACWRNIIAGKQAEIAMKNHLADAYTRAIDQLGAEKEAVQLGGLYALEKIAHSNEPYYRQIIEVLCAFIRLIAGPVDRESSAPSEQPVELTVQTALTILGRRNLSFDKLPQNSDVKIDLAGIKLCSVNLTRANFTEANLYKAYLSGADLSGADLSGADLSGAKLSRAYLSGADLSGADLFEADLSGADLTGAYLSGADLSGADLFEADLTGAKVTVEQLQMARVYTNTILPEYIDKKSLDLQDPLA